jgi:hypothetical protein
MGTAIMILGYSGAGKSTSLRNIPIDEYGLIAPTGKPLSFRTSKKPYVTDDYFKIGRIMQEAESDIIVLDDTQYLMANEFMRRSKETGFQKFTDIGVNFFTLINMVQSLPAEKTVYFLHHIELADDGIREKEKTIGKLLDDKIVIAGLFSIVLKAQMKDGHFFFSTQSTGFDPVKTPMEMFDKKEIDNDLYEVDKAIRSYYGLPVPRKVNKSKAEVKE